MGENKEEWKKASENEGENEMARILREILKGAIEVGGQRTQITWRSKNWFDDHTNPALR